ncbi:hypothetical protein FB45DRAFT_803223 [Roridomyces roridus]|uniref:Uncharacterized protein n=1 Tax=Roridomyces roridus TaxID=1738132 RepID=A0AAD7B7N0_9AGAR|nr:hypothetical protein FB45DRAFT_803223 [Roridomyces roridus]
MSTPHYANGIAPIVTTFGPGTLHTLAFNAGSCNVNVVAAVPATPNSAGITNWLLSFAYDFNDYAFYWDGAGEAFWRFGNSTLMQPVGTSWTDATGIPLGTEVIEGWNVASTAAAATNRGDMSLAFVIPDGLD